MSAGSLRALAGLALHPGLPRPVPLFGNYNCNNFSLSPSSAASLQFSPVVKRPLIVDQRQPLQCLENDLKTIQATQYENAV